MEINVLTVESKANYQISPHYIAEDNHNVKSRGELLIDNWLYSHKIVHAYEHRIYYSTTRYITADWYLPEFKLFIEYWGKCNEKYKRQREFKEKIYNQFHHRLISINNDDISDLSTKLDILLYERQIKNCSQSSSIIPIKNITLLREETHKFMVDYILIGEVIKQPVQCKTPVNTPYVQLMIKDDSGIAKVDVWGSQFLENIKVARELIIKDKIMIKDPVIPKRSYRYSDLWVNERDSRLIKI